MMRNVNSFGKCYKMNETYMGLGVIPSPLRLRDREQEKEQYNGRVIRTISYTGSI